MYPSTGHQPGAALRRLDTQLIIVGSEVLGGEVVDENTPYLLRRLGEIGAFVSEIRVLPDHRARIVAALRESAASADMVIVAGGIGPTHDDCTRPAVAEALGVELVAHPEALARLGRIAGGRAAPAELEMARLPEGAVLLTHREGQSFGFSAGCFVVLPGVPVLLRALVEANRERFSGTPRVRREVVTRLREGLVAEALAALDRGWPAVEWGSYPELTDSGWRLRLVLRAPDEESAAGAEAALRTAIEDLGGA